MMMILEDSFLKTLSNEETIFKKIKNEEEENSPLSNWYYSNLLISYMNLCCTASNQSLFYNLIDSCFCSFHIEFVFGPLW